MSKHTQKYPGLYAGARAIGMKYMTALNRVKLGGMTVEEALAKPVGRGRPRKIERPDPATVAKLYAWHRSGYAPRLRPMPTPTPAPRVARRYNPATHKSTAPLTIQAVVSRYCDNFIKTGEFNADDLALLQAFAQTKREGKPEDARKRPHPDTRRVSPQHEAHHDGGREAPLRDDGGGVAQQPHDAPAG